nr:hypothetical protein [Flavobacterium sp. J372]
MPKDIVVYRFIPLHDDARARFDAVSRTYEYHKYILLKMLLTTRAAGISFISWMLMP